MIVREDPSLMWVCHNTVKSVKRIFSLPHNGNPIHWTMWNYGELLHFNRVTPTLVPHIIKLSISASDIFWEKLKPRPLELLKIGTKRQYDSVCPYVSNSNLNIWMWYWIVMTKSAGNAQNEERVGNKCLRLDMDGDTLNVQQQYTTSLFKCQSRSGARWVVEEEEGPASQASGRGGGWACKQAKVNLCLDQ